MSNTDEIDALMKGVLEPADEAQVEQLDFSFVLASSVHDMKNSLSMLLGSLEEMIQDSPPENDKQKTHISTLQYEASRINSELIQLLNIYRLQNRSLQFSIDENYVIETFEDQIARNDVLFKIKNIEIDVECDENLIWFFDNELLGNVIHNILINSIRYAKSKIKLSASIKNEHLFIVIEDDGLGFPEFMLQAALPENNKNSSADSTRLGLFFAAKIASFHKQGKNKGEIELSNGGSLGGGVFTIILP
ncbi:MAG: K+-sensing histidine kinase KdpD [Cellvibrionaceae bacterium]|jgi:K+-sensing histidine kinase KdpD